MIYNIFMGQCTLHIAYHSKQESRVASPQICPCWQAFAQVFLQRSVHSPQQIKCPQEIAREGSLPQLYQPRRKYAQRYDMACPEPLSVSPRVKRTPLRPLHAFAQESSPSGGRIPPDPEWSLSIPCFPPCDHHACVYSESSLRQLSNGNSNSSVRNNSNSHRYSY